MVKKPSIARALTAGPASREATKTPAPVTSKPATEPTIERGTKPSIEMRPATQPGAEEVTKPTQFMATQIKKDVGLAYLSPGAYARGSKARKPGTIHFPAASPASGEPEKTPAPPTSKPAIEPRIEKATTPSVGTRPDAQPEATESVIEKATKPSVDTQPVAQPEAEEVTKPAQLMVAKIWIELARLLAFEHEAGASALIHSLLERAQAWREADWLRPISPTLTPPGGALLRSLTGHNGKITAIAMTADGRRLVSASEDQTLRVWELSTSSPPGSVLSDPGELHTLLGHTSQVNTVAVTADGRLAISGSSEKSLKVWDLERGMELCSLHGHADTVEKVVITPEGRRVVSASGDKTIRVWDIESGEQLHNLHGSQHIITNLMLAPDGHRIISSSFEDQTIKIWDIPFYLYPGLKYNAPRRPLLCHTDSVNALAVTPDGRQLVSASSDATLKLWDLASGTELLTFQSHPAPIYTVAVTPDGKQIVAGGYGIKAWELDSSAKPLSFVSPDRIYALAVTPDG